MKAILAALAVSLLATGADAATCSSYQAGKVSNSTCQVGSDIGNPGQNNDSTARVNSDLMFGFSDWTSLARDNGLNGTDTGPNTAALNMTGNVQSGSYAVSPVGVFNQLMLVFKSGNGRPDTYIGYLLSALTGTYTSPFLNDKNNNSKDISHVSLYGRTASVAPIPLPAAGILLMTALGGLVLARRRKS